MRPKYFAKGCLMVLLFVLISTTLSWADIRGSLSFSPNDFSFSEYLEQDGEMYTVITPTGPNNYGGLDSLGNPELPSVVVCYSLPLGMEVKNIILLAWHESVLIEPDFPVRPRQALWKTATYVERPEFVEMSEVYQQDEFYPAEARLVTCSQPVSLVRGSGVATIEVRPLRYNPITNKIMLVERIEFSLGLAQSELSPQPTPRRESKFTRLRTISFLKTLVENPLAVDNNLPPALIFDYNIPYYGPNLPDGVPPECVIITNDLLARSFAAYAQWLTAKGIPTQVAHLEDIYQNYEGVDQPEQIHNFIKDRYLNDGLCFALLGGDIGIVPKRLCYPGNLNNYTPPEITQQICDLYYGEMDGIWDYDGDGVWGESLHDRPDLGADVFVGRVPVETPQGVVIWAEKRLLYEQNPGGGDFSYLPKTAISSADQMRDANKHGLIASAIIPFFEVDTTLIEQPSGSDPDPYSPVSQDVIDMLEVGVQFFEMLAHGSPDYGAVRSSGLNNPPRERYGNNQVRIVDTQGKVYCLFSIACDLGMMDPWLIDWWGDEPCLAEVDAETEGGSAASRLNTRWGWVGSSSNLERSFFYVLGTEYGQHRLSHAHFGAKLLHPNYRDLGYGNTLFGCPEMTVWTDLPHTFTVTHPDSLRLSPFNQTVTIRVMDGQMPIPGVFVTLWKDSEVYARGLTDPSGNVSLTIRPRRVGTMSLVCSRTNFIPFQTEITVYGIRNHDLVLGKAETALPVLIWNPNELPSGDSLETTLLSAGYQAEQTADLSDYIDNLFGYTLFVIGGIGEYGEQKITPEGIEGYLAQLLSYLSQGGSMYWEGAWSLIWQDQALQDHFCFDIYTANQNTITYLRGIDTFFVGLDSIGYNEGETAADAISHLPNYEFGNVIEAPEAWYPPAITKAAVYSNSALTMVTNFSWAKLHDGYTNTRVELAHAIMNWLNQSTGVGDDLLPKEFTLHQNYPNPFNPVTTISYDLPQASPTTLEIYNLLGQRVTTLVNGYQDAGRHTAIWDAHQYASGIYLYRIVAGEATETKKMLLTK